MNCDFKSPNPQEVEETHFTITAKEKKKYASDIVSSTKRRDASKIQNGVRVATGARHLHPPRRPPRRPRRLRRRQSPPFIRAQASSPRFCFASWFFVIKTFVFPSGLAHISLYARKCFYPLSPTRKCIIWCAGNLKELMNRWANTHKSNTRQ